MRVIERRSMSEVVDGNSGLCAYYAQVEARDENMHVYVYVSELEGACVYLLATESLIDKTEDQVSDNAILEAYDCFKDARESAFGRLFVLADDLLEDEMEFDAVVMLPEAECNDGYTVADKQSHSDDFGSSAELKLVNDTGDVVYLYAQSFEDDFEFAVTGRSVIDNLMTGGDESVPRIETFDNYKDARESKYGRFMKELDDLLEMEEEEAN